MLLYEDGPIYGPVRSRRLGRSLGVNVLPAHMKICNFNCAYCQCGWTHLSDRACPEEAWPDPEDIAAAAADALRRLVVERRQIDRLTIAGEGEPTLHPRFAEIVERLVGVRDERAAEVPIAILSNSSTLRLPAVRDSLARLDERYLKLDAGDDATLRRLNGYAGSLADLIDDLASIERVTIQTMFIADSSGRMANSGDAEVAAWVRALVAIRPIGVHVYTVDRLPAMPTVKPIGRAELSRIAAKARAAGIPARAFG
jgi:wyosine [tRNA(Phe)-imidazoG37] synthetase (radical SAM superfamily)